MSIPNGKYDSMACPVDNCDYEVSEWDEMKKHLEYKHDWTAQQIEEEEPI